MWGATESHVKKSVLGYKKFIFGRRRLLPICMEPLNTLVHKLKKSYNVRKRSQDIRRNNHHIFRGMKLEMIQKQKENFGNYLSNVQVGILTSEHRTLGAEWHHRNLKREFNLLYYIVSGRCNISMNGFNMTPSSGRLVLLPAGSTISGTSHNGETFEKYYCHFTSTIGRTPLFDLLHMSSMIEVEDRMLIEQHFQELIRHFSEKEMTSALRAKTTLLQILCYFIEKSHPIALHDADNPDMQNMNSVLEYIHEHLADELSVDVLAKQVHFNPRYFIQVFKRMVGYSPMQYIAKQRYEQACMLLSYTRLNIYEIAERVGIHSEYFNKFFKQHSGISPTDYRENAENPANRRSGPTPPPS